MATWWKVEGKRSLDNAGKVYIAYPLRKQWAKMLQVFLFEYDRMHESELMASRQGYRATYSLSESNDQIFGIKRLLMILVNS